MAPQRYPRISHPTPRPSTISQTLASREPLAIRQLVCNTDSYIGTATTETTFTSTITTQVTNTRELTQLQKSDANNPARIATWTQEFVSRVTITTTGTAPATTTRCFPLYDKPTETSTPKPTSAPSTSTASSTSSPVQTSMPVSAQTSSSTTETTRSSRTGVIIGSSIAGVVLLIIFGLAFSCIFYRRRARKAAAQSLLRHISNPRSASVNSPRTSYYKNLARGGPDHRIRQDYVGDMESVSVRARINAQNLALMGEADSFGSGRSFATALQVPFQSQTIVHPEDPYGELSEGRMYSQLRPSINPVLPVPEQPTGFGSGHVGPQTSANTDTPLLPASQKKRKMMTKIVNIIRNRKEAHLSGADAERAEISRPSPPSTAALARMSTWSYLLPRSWGSQARIVKQPDIYPEPLLSSGHLSFSHEYEAVIPEAANFLVTTSSGESSIRLPCVLPFSERQRDPGASDYTVIQQLNNLHHGHQTHDHETTSSANGPHLTGNSPHRSSRPQLDYQSDVSTKSNPNNWSSSPVRPPEFAHLAASTRTQRHFGHNVSREKGDTREDNPYFWTPEPQANFHPSFPERSRTAPANHPTKEQRVYQYSSTSTRDLLNINRSSYELGDLAETVYNPRMHPTLQLKVRPLRISSLDAPTTPTRVATAPPETSSAVSLSIYSQNSLTSSAEEISGTQATMPDLDTKEIDDAIAATAAWEIRQRRETLDRLEDFSWKDGRPNHQIGNSERSTTPVDPPPAPWGLSAQVESSPRLFEEQNQRSRSDTMSEQEWRERFDIERSMRHKTPVEIAKDRDESYAKLCGKHAGWIDPKAKGFRIDYSKLQPDESESGADGGEGRFVAESRKGGTTTPPTSPPKGRNRNDTVTASAPRREGGRRNESEGLGRRSPDGRPQMAHTSSVGSRNQECWRGVVEDERVLAAREAMRIRGEGVSDTNMTDFDMDAFLEKERLKPPRMRTPSRPEVHPPASGHAQKDKTGEKGGAKEKSRWWNSR